MWLKNKMNEEISAWFENGTPIQRINMDYLSNEHVMCIFNIDVLLVTLAKIRFRLS